MWEKRVRSVDERYSGRVVAGLIAQGVAEEVAGTHPKLIRFPGVLEALGVR